MRVGEQIEANRVRLLSEERDRRLRQSGLPKVYADGTRKASSLPTVAQQAITACQMLGTTVGGLYLYGEAGTYKTSVAAAFLAEQVRAGGGGRFVSVPDLFTDLYAIYASDDRRSRADMVDELVTTPRLVLDDLGKEKASDHAAGVVFEILDGRYRNQGPGRWMIVTSNLPIHTLAARFADDTGDPIARRLAELTVAVPMERGAA